MLFTALVVVIGLACTPAFAQNTETGNSTAETKPAAEKTSEPGKPSKLETKDASPATKTATAGSRDKTETPTFPDAPMAWIFALLMLLTAMAALYWRFHSVMKVNKALSTLRVDQIMANDLLTHHERRFRTILGTASDGIFTLSKSGAVESFSQAASQMFGYQPEEMDKQNFSVLLPNDEAKAYDSDIQQYGATGEGQFIGAGPRKTLGQRKDGTTFSMELSISPITLDEEGRFVGVVRDLRKGMEAEQQANEKTDLVNKVFSSMAQGFTVFDKDMNLTAFNAQFSDIVGYCRSESSEDDSGGVACLGQVAIY